MFGHRLSKYELGELRDLQRLVKEEAFKLKVVKGNTALVRHHKRWVERQEDMVKLLEVQREDFINLCCQDRGIGGAVSIDLTSGRITQKHGPNPD